MYHEVTSVLPTTLRIEICNALYIDVLRQVTLLNIGNPTFLRQVAARVTHSLYLPGVCIVKEGDLGSSMFIVFRGHVSGIMASDSPAQELKKVYLVGDVFGKLPCLFHNEWYRKSYRAEVITEILEIHSRDLIHLATIYSDFWKLLKAYVEVTYDSNGESDCIFSPQRARQKNIYDLGEDYQQAPAAKDDAIKRRKAAQPTVSTLHHEDGAGEGHHHPGHPHASHPHHPEKHHEDEASKDHKLHHVAFVPPARSSVRTSNVPQRPIVHKTKTAEIVQEPIEFLYNKSRLTKLKEKLERRTKTKPVPGAGAIMKPGTSVRGRSKSPGAPRGGKSQHSPAVGKKFPASTKTSSTGTAISKKPLHAKEKYKLSKKK